MRRLAHLLALGVLLNSPFSLGWARGPSAFEEHKRAVAQSNYGEGVASLEAGAFPKAESLFRESLKSEPHFERARYQLAAVLHLSGKDEAALSELRKIRKDTDLLVRAVPLLRAEAQMKLGRWNDALKTWRSFRGEGSDFRAIRLQGIAKCLEGLGKSAEAADAWSGYLEVLVRPASGVLKQIAVNRVKASEKEKGLVYCDLSDGLKEFPAYRALCRAQVFRAAFELFKNPSDRIAALEQLQDSLRKDSHNAEAAELLERWRAEG